jgi:hypothetical protein
MLIGVDDWFENAEPVFSGVATMNTTSSLLQTIKINNAALAVTQLKDVFNTS